MKELSASYSETPQVDQEPVLSKEQKAYEKKLKQYEKDKEKYEYFLKNKARITQNKQVTDRHNKAYTNIYNGIQIGISPGGQEVRNITEKLGLVPPDKVIWQNSRYFQNGGNQDAEVFALTQGVNAAIDHTIIGSNLRETDKKYGLAPTYKGSYMYVFIDDQNKTQVVHYPMFNSFKLPTNPIPPEQPKVQEQLADLKEELLPKVSSKEEKNYEKKLQQYEKDLERYEYFVKDKERILNNKRITDENNASRVKGYVETPSSGIYATGYNQWTVHRKLGMIEKEKVLSTIAEYIATNPFVNETKALVNSQKDALERFNSGVKLSASDKKYGFLPTYIGSWITVFLDDESKHQVYEWRMFDSFEIPKKPTPPEKPKVKEQLADLKKEVMLPKEMNWSVSTTIDGVKGEKLEIKGRGPVDKETYDLYIKFKTTRNDRPKDLDLSFEHFQSTYLDKTPEFMRKKISVADTTKQK